MKKIYITIITAMMAVTTWADGRTPEEMLRIAQQKLGKDVTATALCNAKDNTGNAKGSTGNAQGEASNEAYATYNAEDGNGFVIVGADERLPEILGYSTTGSLTDETMAPALRLALENLSLRMAASQDTVTTTAAKIKHQGNTMTTAVSYVPVDPLITTKWDQDNDYAYYCPTYSFSDGLEGVTATGCVATALAQVINYWGRQGKFPTQGIDSVLQWSSYQKSYINKGFYEFTYDMSYDFSNKLDFANMNDYYGTTYFGSETKVFNRTEQEVKAVANLMMACGAIAKMHYGKESSANVTYLDDILTFYGFAPGSRHLQQDFYDQDEWQQIIYNQIMQGHPIPFAAITLDGSSGHSFVLDGIDSDGNVHVNWGWGGKSDAFFALSYLYPDEQGTGGSESSQAYNYDCEAIVDFADTCTIPVSCYRMSGIEYDPSNSSLRFYGLTTTSHAYSDALMALVVDNLTTIQRDTIFFNQETSHFLLPETVQTSGSYIETSAYKWIGFNFSGFPDGWYSFRAITQAPGQKGWSEVRSPQAYYETLYLKIENGVVVDGDGSYSKVTLKSTIALSEHTAPLRAHRRIYLDVTVTNTSDYEITDLENYVFQKSPVASRFSSLGLQAMSLKPGESKTFKASFMPYYSGQYKFFATGTRPELIDINYYMTDTLSFNVEEGFFTQTTVEYDGNYDDNEKYDGQNPLNIKFTGDAETACKGKIYFSIRPDYDPATQIWSYEQSYDVQTGDVITIEKQVSPSLFTSSGLYLLCVSYGDKDAQDMYVLGEEYNHYTGYLIDVSLGTAVSDVTAATSSATLPAHDLFGRRINPATFHGIMVQGGKKRVVK